MIGRRTALAAALGLAAGCAAPARPAPPAPPGTPPGPTGTPPAARPPAQPTREQVLARYADQSPHAWGTDLPGVRATVPDGALALTFDACGGPGGDGYDAALIGILRRLRVPATLFLNARWVDANPGPAGELAADPLFEIGNHGTAHRPLSVTGRPAYGITGTADPAAAYDEVAGNRAKLTALLGGRAPGWFRSGTAHYDEVALRLVGELGERVAGFAVNADGGATFTPAQVAGEVAAAPPGSVLISHFNHPAAGTAEGYARALPALLDAGRRFVRLSD
ncbi:MULTISPECIES: polysaccharide deacetylase family protein [Kitasatospora]|uniref:Putative hydrolase n=1 Tax=Kitasatospora setae (strain ATCC 33774 / DSM 43861 / JCM 3304 / KCC A-0304 / NBRC 14216 / KM-6054) TaxID=452652 RepID=E4N645_KITSK|nr:MULTISPECIES: polysaccharide deacetylase family protein [Kitasatospora]BAJ26676.1 putative hydrolase [Kitasatospora setae KM-6054]